MSRSIYFRLLLILALSLAVAGMPQSSFAQHGGFHGGGGFRGGGGFHGGSAFHGGGFGSFHGGRSFVGFYGRGFGGYRGGFYRGYGGGFYRGYREGFYGGYPRFYSNWGFGLGFWPYWGAYPWYGYGYSPWWGYAPYAYSYPYGYGYGYGYDPYNYPDRDYDRYPRDRGRRDDRDCRDYRYSCPAPDNRPKDNKAPPKPSSGPSTDSSYGTNYLTVNVATPASPESRNGELLRPALRNAIAALRAMPPAARERQLDSGRYAGLSPEDREFLRNQFRQAVPETVN